MSRSIKCARTNKPRTSFLRLPLDLIHEVAKYLWCDEVHANLAPTCRTLAEVARRYTLPHKIMSINSIRTFVMTYTRLVLKQPATPYQPKIYSDWTLCRKWRIPDGIFFDQPLACCVAYWCPRTPVTELNGFIQLSCKQMNDYTNAQRLTALYAHATDFMANLCSDWTRTASEAHHPVMYHKRKTNLHNGKPARGTITYVEWRLLLAILLNNGLHKEGTAYLTSFVHWDGYGPDILGPNKDITLSVWPESHERVMRLLPLKCVEAAV